MTIAQMRAAFQFGFALALAACAGKKDVTQAPLPGAVPIQQDAPLPSLDRQPSTGVSGSVIQRGSSRWVPVAWTELPGLEDDDLHAAWNAWLHSCKRPVAPFVSLCREVRRLTLASAEEQLRWMQLRLQPYRVETKGGAAQGQLTSYFEPQYLASRLRSGDFQVPLYAPPPSLPSKSAWYTRREMETLPQAQAALAGHEIAWVQDPVAAMILQIQGSGRLVIMEPDGRQQVARLAFAATNNQPYRSPGAWLKSQHYIEDATWPGIHAWLDANPHRIQDFMWSNPRVVFFAEEDLDDVEAGPRGAHGVPLTAGRSIAVDPQSIPYGTPVWMASTGPVAHLQRLVVAQDTGSAIKGAVRADYFAGRGAEAGELAGRLNQPLQMWVLWPRS